MDKDNEEKKKKGFFAQLFEKLDKKLEAKSKKSGCCCGPKDNKDADGDSCCS